MTRVATWALGLSYTIAWAIAGWLWKGPPTDLDFFFWPSVRIALRGHPLLVYAVRFQGVIANDNGPLSLVPLAAVGAVASWLGWLDDERRRRVLVLAVFSIFTLLMAREAVAAIDRLRGARLVGRSRILAYGTFALSPILLISVLGYGHVEQPMTVWLVLFAVRTLAGGRPAAAGLGFGLAILTRTLAALPLIPLALLVLVRGRWRALAWLVATATFIVALGVLPFILADPGDTIYSLLTHRASLPTSGGSLWQLVVGTPYQSVAQRADIVFVLGLAVLLSLTVIAARRDLEPRSRDTYGLLALTALALPLLAKSVWPYYFLDAYVFGAVWWFGQPRPLVRARGVSAAMVPLAAVLGTLLTEYEMGAASRQVRLLEGVGLGVILAVVAAALLVRLRRRDLARS